MSSFENREEGYEKKFAHDEEQAFKIEARTCKLFGLWIAEQLGLEGADAETYAKEVVTANLEIPGFDDVKEKVRPDIEQKGLDISDHKLDMMLEKFMNEAKEQILSDRR